jgi:hypothetical protein
MGATEEILDGRLMSGMLIAILRFTGVAVVDLLPFSIPFLLTAAAAAFLLAAVVAETLLVLTFLVDVLVAIFFAGFPLLTGVAAFFPAAAFCGTVLFPRFAVVKVFRDDAAGFFGVCLAGFFLLTLPFAALLFLVAVLAGGFFGLLPDAFLVTDFFRTAMLSILAFAQESGVCKTADYT